jgi:hypothetical protein
MSNPVSRSDADAQLAEHAAAIRRLDKRTIETIVETGKHLIAAKELAGHGHWLSWLRQDLGWASESSALRYMNVARLNESVRLTDLSIDLTALYRLASPSTPPEVVEHVVALGRRITDEDVAARMIEYEVVDDEPPQAREIRYVAGDIDDGLATRITHEGDAEQAWRTRYGAVREVPCYRGEVEEPPVRRVRLQVETTRETVVVPYYIDAPRKEEAPRVDVDDIRGRRIRSKADELLQGLSAIVAALAGNWDIGEIVAALTDDERDQFRRGIEAVDRLKAALDETTNVIQFPKLD